MALAKTIFITGTDTGVGKTVLTGLLLHHLREKGVRALAMKPFCSGSRRDVKLLKALQNNELTDEEINPYYFKEAVAPLVAARMHHKIILLKSVLEKIKGLQKRCDLLLIEGAGGLLAPLGEGFTNKDLISQIDCAVLIVGRNRLGTINHTLLTVKALQAIRNQSVKAVLMEGKLTDDSAQTNCEILRETLAEISVFRLPFIGASASSAIGVENCSKKMKKPLAQILKFDNLTTFF